MDEQISFSSSVEVLFSHIHSPGIDSAKPVQEARFIESSLTEELLDKIYFTNSNLMNINVKKGRRKVQGVLQSQTAPLPRPEEEEETDKYKQEQTEQTYEKH